MNMYPKHLLALPIAFMVMSCPCQGQTVMTLDEVFRQADATSQSIRVSQTAQQSAAEGRQAARSAMLPDVNLSLSGSYIGNATLMDRGFSTHGTTDVIYACSGPVPVSLGKQDTPHWGNSFALEVSQVLYAGGAISAGVRMAELGEQMAALDVERQKQEVRLLLVGHYLDLYKLNNQIEVLDHNIELTRQLLKDMHSREEQGVVLPNDITRFELQLQSLELARTQVEDAARILNRQMVITLHLPEGTVIVPDSREVDRISADQVADMSEQAWQQQAAEGNLGLRQAELGSQLAEQQFKATRADRLPHVALVAEDHLFGPYTDDLIPTDANVNAWFIGIGVQYNLGSLWKNHGVRKARLESQKATEQVQLAREGIEQGVQACYINLVTSVTEVRTQQKSVELAVQNYSVTNNRYDNGLALLTDMIDASNTKLSAEMNLVNARINLVCNYYKLKYTTHSL